MASMHLGSKFQLQSSPISFHRWNFHKHSTQSHVKLHICIERETIDVFSEHKSVCREPATVPKC